MVQESSNPSQSFPLHPRHQYQQQKVLWKLGCWCRWILQACDLVAAEWACSEDFPSRKSALGPEVRSAAEGAHLRGCSEPPIELCAMHLKSHGRNVDPRIFESVHAGLENSNTDRWILREPRGDYEAGGSTTDDNVIILCDHLRRWSTGSHSEWPVSVFEALSANVYDSRWTLHSTCWSISIMVRGGGWVGTVELRRETGERLQTTPPLRHC